MNQGGKRVLILNQMVRKLPAYAAAKVNVVTVTSAFITHMRTVALNELPLIVCAVERDAFQPVGYAPAGFVSINLLLCCIEFFVALRLQFLHCDVAESVCA